MRSVIENVLFEGLGHVVKITQPDGGEVAPVQTEDWPQLVMMGIKALQGSVSLGEMQLLQEEQHSNKVPCHSLVSKFVSVADEGQAVGNKVKMHTYVQHI